MSNYMKQPLLENMRSNLYSFYTDKTSDVTSIEQLAIYATFLRNQSISEHFIGLIPISKEVGAHLSAVIMSALENLYVKNDINPQQARFVCMDTTNVNSGEKNDLKRHSKHKVSLLKWIGCNNHKLALTSKHLIPSFQCEAEIDIFLLNLWKYFKHRPLAMNILGNSSEMYVIALPSQYAPALLDDKHTSVHVKHSTSILKISSMHLQHHIRNERKLKH